MSTLNVPGQQPIKMTKVDAAMFEAIGYSSAGRKLYIQFRGKPAQCFEGVPGFRFQGLMSSPRKDGYFKNYIQNCFLAKDII